VLKLPRYPDSFIAPEEMMYHPNLRDPGTNITSISFGRITSARGADAGGNRIGQFALRFEF